MSTREMKPTKPEDSQSSQLIKEAKYLSIAQSIENEIQRGGLQPGDQLPTFPQMREMYGATPATVERVYKVLEAKELITRKWRRGVFVTDLPQRKVTGVIGCISEAIVDNVGDPYWSAIMQGIRRAALEARVQVLLVDYLHHSPWEKMDGALCIHLSDENNSLLPPGIAIVGALRTVSGRPCVVADDFDGGYQAAKHLLELGHRRIATFLNMETVEAQQRLRGFNQALSEAGIRCESQWNCEFIQAVGRDSGENGFSSQAFEQMQLWLEQGWREFGCTAIFAHNDFTAIGIMRALQVAGLDVPSDVSVVGFDGTATLQNGLRLTTIELPLQQIGITAVEMLLQLLEKTWQDSRLLNDGVVQESRCLPVHLSVGDTTCRARNG